MEVSVGIIHWPLYSRLRNPVPTEYDAEWVPEPIWTFWRNYLYLQELKPTTVQSVSNSLFCAIPALVGG